MIPFTAEILARCTGATPFRAAPYVEPLRAAMALYAIDSVARMSSFLGNVAVETQYLNAVEENLNYTTASRLREIFPSCFNPAKGGHYIAEEYTRNPAGLSRIRFGGYHGRGLMHLTWLDAYQQASEDLGHDYVGNPALVMQPSHAALTACWFWTQYKNLNPLADANNLPEIRRKVNGPAMLGLAEVRKYKRAAEVALTGG
jgi:putative chitinase